MDFCDEMINVAESRFKISIRKKTWRQTVMNLHAGGNKGLDLSTVYPLKALRMAVKRLKGIPL